VKIALPPGSRLYARGSDKVNAASLLVKTGGSKLPAGARAKVPREGRPATKFILRQGADVVGLGGPAEQSYSASRMTAPGALWRFADGGTWNLSARTHILGILNVTPDSFSDGGLWLDTDAAVAQGLRLAEAGADGIDVGGESTRPGAPPVPADAETKRVVPVIRALREKLPRDRCRLTVDTNKAGVAEAALLAGADAVNDVTGLRGDPEMAPLLARTGAGVIVMHMRGTPRTMQNDPRYADLMSEIAEELRGSLGIARAAGVADDRIVVDPGVGFAKSAEHNLELLRRLSFLAGLGRPILIGVSRKSFLGRVTGLPPEERLEASLAAGAVAIVNGASILRVHDVGASLRMTRTVDAILRAGPPSPAEP
jgi:dihydropteroate synthase